ncbi:hypothetical protein EBR03_09870 [bacterium]|nr:hypothetical protein [bacterium]
MRIPFLPGDEKEKTYQRKLNWLRLFTFFSFMWGSAIAAFVFTKLGYHGFLVPALTSLVVLFQAHHVMKIYMTEEIPKLR